VWKYLVVPNVTSRIKPVPDCAGKMARRRMNSVRVLSAGEMTRVMKLSPIDERSEATVLYAYESRKRGNSCGSPLYSASLPL